MFYPLYKDKGIFLNFEIMIKYEYLLFIVAFLTNCLSITAQENYSFPYNLSNPDKVQKLPSKLYEISGISWLGNNKIASVQDEKGNIYIVDFITGEICDKIDFGNDGDYEDITIVNNVAWILKSNGNLYRVKHFADDGKAVKTKKYETPLKKKNDAEGLTWDKQNHKLLIACKGYPYTTNIAENHKRAVYEFDLITNKLNPVPKYLIDMDSVAKFRNYNTMARMGIELLSWLDENKGDLYFQPSGIAIHPFTGNIYLLASVGDLLLIIDRENNILHFEDLDDILFKQPEGITFDEKGNLYISNEGRDSKATIIKFSINK